MKIFYTLFLMILMPVITMAQILPETVYALSPKALSYKNLKNTDIINLYVVKTGKLSNDLDLKQGEKIEVKIVKYVKPKRGKRNGYYNVKTKINKEFMEGTMRISTPTDYKEIAAQAGTSIAGFVLHVPLLTQAVAASKGLIKPNKNQSRLQSAAHNAYESSPLKYVEKGENFVVNKEGMVVIRLKAED